jgi:hypothetical protein
VSVTRAARALQGDALEPLLRDLYVSTRGQPVPSNPYSDDALMFRICNYRHQVTHRRRNPFHFQIFLGDAALSTARPGSAFRPQRAPLPRPARRGRRPVKRNG